MVDADGKCPGTNTSASPPSTAPPAARHVVEAERERAAVGREADGERLRARARAAPAGEGELAVVEPDLAVERDDGEPAVGGEVGAEHLVAVLGVLRDRLRSPDAQHAQPRVALQPDREVAAVARPGERADDVAEPADPADELPEPASKR